MKNINKNILEKLSTGEYKNFNNKILLKYFEILDAYNKYTETENLIGKRFYYNEILKLFCNPKNAAYLLANLSTIKTNLILDNVNKICYTSEQYLNTIFWANASNDTAINFNYYIRRHLKELLPSEIHDKYEYHRYYYPTAPIEEHLYKLLGIDLLKYINKTKKINGYKTKGFLFVVDQLGTVYDSGYKLTQKNTPLKYVLKEDGLYDIKGNKFIQISDKCEKHFHIFNYTNIENVEVNTNIGEIKTSYFYLCGADVFPSNL